MKKSKLYIFCLIVISIIMLITGCSTTAKAPVENKIEKARENPSEIAIIFVKSLLNKDYKTTLETMKIEESELVSSNDIKEMVGNSSFAKLDNIDCNQEKMQFESSEKKDGNIVIITLLDTSKKEREEIGKFNVSVLLDNDKKWTIDYKEFYCKNYSFRTAGENIVVSINGVELDQKYIKNENVGQNGCEKEYTIPCINKNEISITLDGSKYGYSANVMPSDNNEITEQDCVLKKCDEADACVRAIQNIWNNSYSLYVKNRNKNSITPYISEKATDDVAGIIAKGFNSFLKITYDIKDKKDINYTTNRNEKFNMSQCVLNTDEGVAQPYWISDTKILVNFKYELQWYYVRKKINKNMTRNSSILLSYENGEYKIAQLSDEGLFTIFNENIKEW